MPTFNQIDQGGAKPKKVKRKKATWKDVGKTVGGSAKKTGSSANKSAPPKSRRPDQPGVSKAEARKSRQASRRVQRVAQRTDYSSTSREQRQNEQDQLEAMKRFGTETAISTLPAGYERSLEGLKEYTADMEGMRSTPAEILLGAATFLPVGRAASLGAKLLGTGGTRTTQTVARVASKAAKTAPKIARSSGVKTTARIAKPKPVPKPKPKPRKSRPSSPRKPAPRTAKQKAKATWKAKQPATLTKAGRQVKKRKIAEGALNLGTHAPDVATVGAGTVATTGAAIADDVQEGKPLRTLGTTARVAKSLPTAMVGDVVDIAKFVGGDEEAGKRAFESWKAYYDSINTLSQGGEEGIEVAQEDLGLVPVLTGALGAYGLAKPFIAPKTPKPAKVSKKSQRLTRRIESAPDDQKAQALKKKRANLDQGPLEAKRQRGEEAERKARTNRRISAISGVEMGGRKGAKRLAFKLMGKKLNKNVSLLDVARYVSAEGLHDTSPEFARAELIRRRDALRDPTGEIGPHETTTRKVLDAVIENPAAVSDPDLVQFLRVVDEEIRHPRSIERHQQRKQDDTITTPDPLDERPRLLHLQRAEDIRTDFERVPNELRGRTKVEPKRGQIAEKAIREEAKALRRKALMLRAQASSQRHGGLPKAGRNLPGREMVRELERGLSYASGPDAKKRSQLLEEAELAKLEARALEVVINRAKKAEALDARASVVEAGGMRQAGEPSPAEMRAEAQALRQRVEADQAKLRGEAEGEAQARIAEKGYSQPIFFQQKDITDKGNVNAAAGNEYRGSKIPTKEKFKTGDLHERGQVDESGPRLMESLHEERVLMELRQHVRELLDEVYDPGDGKVVRTDTEWRKLEEAGKLPNDMRPFPAQEWQRVLQRSKWDEALGEFGDRLLADLREGKGIEGKKYALISGPRLEEFTRQLDNVSKGLKRARMIGRIQTSAMLATSPIWFELQLVASPVALAFRHPNPARAARVSYQLLKDSRKVPKIKWARFKAEFDGTAMDVFDMREIEAGVRPETVRDMHDALSVGRQSIGGRAVDHVLQGGPLIAMNRRFEANVRTFGALLEADKLIHPPVVRRLAESIGGATDEVAKQMAQLRGKSQPEIIDFLLSREGQAGTKRIRDGVKRGLGDWTSLTSRERTIATVIVFYPFLRFSAKWLALTSPKDRPLTYAFAINAAQQNAQELDENGEPGFFSGYGDVVFHGEEDETLDLGRIVPGGNAVVDAIGEGEIGLHSLARMTQPVIGGTIMSFAGLDPLTGEESKYSFLEQMGRTIGGLSPLTRDLANTIGPERSNVSKAFDKIYGRDDRGYFEKLLVPDITGKLSENARAHELSEAMEGASSPDSGEWISRALAMETPPDPEEYGEAFAEASDRASESRDRLNAILEDLGLDSPEDAEWIDKFFAAQYAARSEDSKTVTRTSNGLLGPRTNGLLGPRTP